MIYLIFYISSIIGISKEETNKFKLIVHGKELTTKVVEWKFKSKDCDASGAQTSGYGIMALAKSSDGKFIDCMLALYKLEFELTATNVIYKEYTALLGLFKWRSPEKPVSRYIDKKAIEQLQNFFRLKALKAFEQEGIIDRISYTD